MNYNFKTRIILLKNKLEYRMNGRIKFWKFLSYVLVVISVVVLIINLNESWIWSPRVLDQMDASVSAGHWPSFLFWFLVSSMFLGLLSTFIFYLIRLVKVWLEIIRMEETPTWMLWFWKCLPKTLLQVCWVGVLLGLIMILTIPFHTSMRLWVESGIFTPLALWETGIVPGFEDVGNERRAAFFLLCDMFINPWGILLIFTVTFRDITSEPTFVANLIERNKRRTKRKKSAK